MRRATPPAACAQIDAIEAFHLKPNVNPSWTLCVFNLKRFVSHRNAKVEDPAESMFAFPIKAFFPEPTVILIMKITL